ncbi:MAG: hypothetical protein MUF42_07080 [Cytophagaceae bacterium]|jgi:antitoxin component YwqK of YwqJK toxin-antitoxin module|nr:hypothetical protein [Cytophagaceae bacterium]
MKAFIVGMILFAYQGYAQKGVSMFMNKDFEFSFRDSALYYRTGDMELGFPRGPIEDFYLSGKLLRKLSYTHEYQPEGDYWEFYESGKKKEKGYYENGNYFLHSYWDESGLRTVKKGFGRITYFYENGKKKAEGYIEHGRKAGMWIYYFRNEQKSEIWEYKEDEELLITAWDKKGRMVVENGNGNYKRHYGNGVIQCAGSFQQGRKHGKWVWNFSNGKTERTGEFSEGLETGTHIYYFNNGTSRMKINYQDGKLHGILIKYHLNGRIQSSCEYKAGEMSEALRRFDEYGNRIPQEDNQDDHPHWQNFNSRIVKTTYF